MKVEFVAQLRCPKCGGQLALNAYKSVGDEVIDGSLTSTCGAAYVVSGGVPSMIPARHLATGFARAYREQLTADAPALAALSADDPDPEFSFSWQWGEHAYNDLTWELLLEQRVTLFYRYLGLERGAAQGLRMLDAGCGNGTLSAELAGDGINVVALDFSGGAHRAFQYEVFNSRVSQSACSRIDYVQGDLQQPPFANDEFDLIYADGVLHHTPDTRRTFLTLTSRVRPGGQFFVWLYRSDTTGLATLKRHLVHAVRVATGWMSYRGRLMLCYVAAVPILASVALLRLVGWRGRRIIPIRQKAINLFDTIAPTYNHEHTPEETMGWFREAGFEDVREVTIRDFRLSVGGFAVLGRRPASSALGRSQNDSL